MLPTEENELITHTDKGRPMGELLRRYWLPVLLSEEIPAPDCPPVQVRFLGEELVAFRDTQGRIGLLEEHCAHRGTSLAYARNEECGLRCIYHGWKYDVKGQVVDTPAERGSGVPDPYKPGSVGVRHASPSFKDKIHQRAYPCVEAGGMVFAYMGPKEMQPEFPNYTWTQLPLDQTYVTKSLLECNYLQGLEGECDSSHLSFLHRQFDPAGRQDLSGADSAPTYETEETDFGVRLIALRRAANGGTYVRVSSFVAPVSCWVPARNKEVHIYVPADDQHCWRYDFGFLVNRLANDADRSRGMQIGPDFVRIRTQRNHYLQDRELQRTADFTGIQEFLNEDACATETMGPIYDRSREHLGLSDKGVIAVRRYLVDTVRRFKLGIEAPHIVTDPSKNDFRHVDTIAEVIPAGETWRDHYAHLTPTMQRSQVPVSTEAL